MKLKQIRENKGISQKELANILNLKPTTYNGYEKETSEPNIETLKKLADFYKVTIDELVGHEVPYLINKAKYTDVQLEIIKELEFLNHEQSYMLLAYIDGIKSIQVKRENLIEKINKGE